MADVASPPMRLCLLSAFELWIDHRRVQLAFGAQRLLALLALKNTPMARTHVADALWPDAPAARAAASLRSSLWRVHQLRPGLVDASSQQVVLGRTVAVDLHEVLDRAHRLVSAPADCADILTPQSKVDLSTDLLPDWFDDDWLIIERERHRQLRLHALEAMCERLTRAGRYAEAVEAGLAAVGSEPLRETAHHALIRAHLAEGNRAEALRQYETYRRLLRDELGLDPSAPAELSPILATRRRPIAVRR
jgi:DNA-binding SARP family transcriptional activator